MLREVTNIVMRSNSSEELLLSVAKHLKFELLVVEHYLFVSSVRKSIYHVITVQLDVAFWESYGHSQLYIGCFLFC